MEETGFRRLIPQRIIGSTQKISDRLGKEFPDSGLYKVSQEILTLACKADRESHLLRRPIYWVWVVNFVLLFIIAAAIVSMMSSVHIPSDKADFFDIIQVMEAAINDIVLIGAGVFFLFTMETRVKRSKAMKHLHELRAIAHVIDMHQLTKDPMPFKGAKPVILTDGRRALTPEELAHYLDYCSDFLAVIGKIAALYIQHFDDPVVLASVNEIETLTNALNQKIWQKLTMIERQESRYTPADFTAPISKSSESEGVIPQ